MTRPGYLDRLATLVGPGEDIVQQLSPVNGDFVGDQQADHLAEAEIQLLTVGVEQGFKPLVEADLPIVALALDLPPHASQRRTEAARRIGWTRILTPGASRVQRSYQKIVVVVALRHLRRQDREKDLIHIARFVEGAPGIALEPRSAAGVQYFQPTDEVINRIA